MASVAPSFTIVLVLAAGLAAAPDGRAQSGEDAAGRRGWALLDDGRPREAAETFDQALARRPGDASLLTGAAIAAYRTGRTDDARSFLLRALSHRPGFTPASMFLGDLLYRTGDLQGAVTVYEEALAHAPGDEPLTLRLEQWRKELDLLGRFTAEIGTHFTVLFEGPEEAELAARAVSILERAYWRIGGSLYTYPHDVIPVVLYTREQFRNITQSPAWAGGAFDGRIRVPVRGALQDLQALEHVLAHEFTHALVRSIAPRNVPVWLDEGLAVHYEGTDPLARRELVRVAGDRRLPLAQLEGSFSKLAAGDAELAYAQSAVAVERLIDLAGPPAVVNLLTALGHGVPLPEAFERHVFLSYAAFQKSLLEESSVGP